MSNIKLDDETRLKFNELLKESDAADNTEKIRRLKHSSKIKEQVSIMLDIKKRYSRLDKKTMDKMIDTQCNWLFSHYFNLFNKCFEKCKPAVGAATAPSCFAYIV